MSGYPFSGPTAPENNPPIEPENFQPSAFNITAITLGATTTITTQASFGVNCNYVVGQLVRLLIPPTYGTRELNQKTAYVISIPGTNQVVLDLDSRGMTAFVSSPTYGPTKPQIVSVGDINTGIISSTGRNIPTTTIPGSFQNIS